MTMMTDDQIASNPEQANTDANVAVKTVEAPVAPVDETPNESVSSETVPTVLTEEPGMAQPEAPTAEAPAPVETAPAPAPEPPAPAAPVAPEAPKAAAEPTMSDADLFEAAMAELDQPVSVGTDTNYRKLSKGDRVEATVIQVERDRVFVDLGTKSEGVIPLAELSTETLESAVGQINVGDKIHVIVMKPEGSGGEGNPIVSKKKADFEQVWYTILDKFNAGEVVNALVVNRVKGGLEVDLGVRGFVPATHVGNGKLRNIEKYVGQPLECKIIEVDRERKKVVLSNRLAEEEKRDAVKGKIFDNYKPGDVVEGTVRRLTDYGAFVDLGGMDGLLHISEMSWMRINHPREVLKEGQKLKVMVLKLDEGAGKISLGLRQVLPDPWNLIKENYKIGQRLNCTIGRMVSSGAFIKLPEGAEAFLPVSEISNRRIGKPSDVLTDNQEVEVAIIDLRPDERRMVLSMRAAGTAVEPPASYEPPGNFQTEFEEDRPRGMGFGKAPTGKKGKKPRRGRDDDDMDTPIMGRVPTGGATIGERLGMLKGLLRQDDDDADTDEPETDKETDETEE